METKINLQKHRKRVCFFANTGFIVCKGWSILGFDIPDRVFISIIADATASVIGLFVIVVRYLFPSQPTSTNSKRHL